MVKNLVEYIVKQLAEQPDKVTIEIIQEGSKDSIKIHVAPDDFKRIIGKEGRIIKAIRSLGNALKADQTQLTIDIVQE